MYYVYLLRSQKKPAETYVGSTGNLRARLADHSAGKSIHTNKFRPWQLDMYIAFPDKQLAARFENYLKTGSGRAFAVRHFHLPATRKSIRPR
jgi:putative endonuclease